MTKTKTKQMTTKDEVLTPQEDKIQAAAQLLMEDRIKREQAFVQEYSELVEQLCKKYGCKLSISQPQITIQAL